MLSSLVAATVLASVAAVDPVDLKVGDPAPEFTAVDDQGQKWKSTDHVGKKILVVYFYPADLTGGCTAQACAFRDDQQELEKLGVEVVGVSGDSPENHRIFKAAHDLDFTLLADEQGKLASTFGVPTKPGGTFNTKVDGKDVSLVTGVRAARWTFVIGPDGKIAYKNTQVKAAEDSKAVLEVVRKLKPPASDAGT